MPSYILPRMLRLSQIALLPFRTSEQAILSRSTHSLSFERYPINISKSQHIHKRAFQSSSQSLQPDSAAHTTMATNGEARPKRRQSPTHPLERPSKHLKPDMSSAVFTPGDVTPANGTVYNVEEDLSSAPALNAMAAATDSPEWQATIEKVVKSVVSIHFCQTCSFDTDLSMSSQATGFVVDAERGYIMTNRHVVCSGPFWGYCIFDNHEEVSDRPRLRKMLG